MFRSSWMLTASLLLLSSRSLALAQSSEWTPATLVAKITEKYKAVQQYSFEGHLDVVRRHNDGPKEIVLLNGKVMFVAAPDGKYSVRIEKPDGAKYTVICDGRKLWTYLPAQRKYSQQSVDRQRSTDDLVAHFDEKPGANRDPAVDFMRLFMPILTHMPQTSDSIWAGKNVLTVVIPKDDHEHQQVLNLYLTDVETLSVARMAWTAAYTGKERVLVRFDLRIEKLNIADPIPASEFVFNPPKGVILVDSLDATKRPRS